MRRSRCALHAADTPAGQLRLVDRRAVGGVPRLLGFGGGVGPAGAHRDDQRNRGRRRRVRVRQSSRRTTRGSLVGVVVRIGRMTAGSGADQTVEQVRIFGTQVRAAISLGLADRTSTPDSRGARRCRSCPGRRPRRTDRRRGTRPVQHPLRKPSSPTPPSTTIWGSRRPREPGCRGPQAPVGNWTSRCPSTSTAGHRGRVGSGRACIRSSRACQPSPSPRRRIRRRRWHPLALDAIRPQQAIICGRPTLHRGVAQFSPTRRCACTPSPPPARPTSGQRLRHRHPRRATGEPREGMAQGMCSDPTAGAGAVDAELDARQSRLTGLPRRACGERGDAAGRTTRRRGRRPRYTAMLHSRVVW